MYQYYTNSIGLIRTKGANIWDCSQMEWNTLVSCWIGEQIECLSPQCSAGGKSIYYGHDMGFAHEVGPHHRTKHKHFNDTNMSPYLFPFLWNCMVWTVDIDGLHPYIPFLCKKVSNHVHAPVQNTRSTTHNVYPTFQIIIFQGVLQKFGTRKELETDFVCTFTPKYPKSKSHCLVGKMYVQPQSYIV